MQRSKKFKHSLLFHPSFLYSVFLRSPSTATFHTRPDFSPLNKNAIFDPEPWVVKLICSVIVFRCSKASKIDFLCLEYFGRSLDSCTSYEVIKRIKDPILGLEFFDFLKCKGVNQSTNTYGLLVQNLCRVGQHAAALRVVFDGHLPDRSILDFLVSSCVQVGKFNIAEAVFVRAHNSEIRLNSFTYNCYINTLVKRNQVDEAVRFFREQHLRFGFCPDTCSFNIVIKGLCRIGEVDRAFEFFDDIESFDCFPDVVTYNTLISGLFRAGEVDRGHALLKEMHSKDYLSPDVLIYTSAISGYRKLGRMKDASILFDEMVSFGIRPNSFTYNVLIDGFGKAGDMVSAAAMYKQMLRTDCLPDVVTLTSLLDGYCRAGEVDEAMKLWHEMGQRSISPSAYTFSVLITAFCKENRLTEARDLLRQLKGKGLVPQPFMYNPVIDGFCKAGNVDEANAIMMEMEKSGCNHDKFTYTILIIGHCVKGRMLEAITIFNKMLTSVCTPDNITVHSLRSRLLKAGMPNEAKQVLLSLSEKENLSLLSSREVHSMNINQVPLKD